MLSRPTTPQLRPCLAELLRTCVYPPSLLLRVERILTECSKRSGESETGHSADEHEPLEQNAYRLLLSDGQLMVQGVLNSSLHRIFEAEEVSPGSILNVRKFVFRRAKRRCGQGEIVYLGIQHFEIVISASPATAPALVTQDQEGGFVRDETYAEDARSRQKVLRSTPPISNALTQEEVENMPSEPSSQDSNGFESSEVDFDAMKRNRNALRELSRNTQPSRITLLHQTGSPRKRRKIVGGTTRSTTTSPAKSTSIVQQATAQRLDQPPCAGDDRPNSTTIPAQAPEARPNAAGSPTTRRPPSRPTTANASSAQRPQTPSEPPFHCIASLLNPHQDAPLPSRNYICSVLGIVSWVSPTVLKPNSGFPAKRHIKIHDLSITNRPSGVTIAVFIDAATFRPDVGTIALFRGVMMNTFQSDIILNVYASLRGQEWYVPGQERLKELGHGGDDVKQLRDWWSERSLGTRNAG